MRLEHQKNQLRRKSGRENGKEMMDSFWWVPTLPCLTFLLSPQPLITVSTCRLKQVEGHDPNLIFFSSLVWNWVASLMAQWVKNPPGSAGDTGDVSSIPGWGRSPGGGHGNPLQYSCLENLWTEEPGGLWSSVSQKIEHDWGDSTHTHTQCIYVNPNLSIHPTYPYPVNLPPTLVHTSVLYIFVYIPALWKKTKIKTIICSKMTLI